MLARSLRIRRVNRTGISTEIATIYSVNTPRNRYTSIITTSLLRCLPVDGPGECIADLRIGYAGFAQLIDGRDEFFRRPLLQVEFAVGLGLGMDDGAAIALGFDDLIAFEELVGLGHRLAVELEIDRELADGGQRLARLQHSGGDRSLDLLDQLFERGLRTFDVDGDFHRVQDLYVPGVPMVQLVLGTCNDALRQARVC